MAGQNLLKSCMGHSAFPKNTGHPFANIKPTDGVFVGMFPKVTDQVGENCRYAREILAAEAR